LTTTPTHRKPRSTSIHISPIRVPANIQISMSLSPMCFSEIRIVHRISSHVMSEPIISDGPVCRVARCENRSAFRTSRTLGGLAHRVRDNEAVMAVSLIGRTGKSTCGPSLDTYNKLGLEQALHSRRIDSRLGAGGNLWHPLSPFWTPGE
jgi:hypothetical protein